MGISKPEYTMATFRDYIASTTRDERAADVRAICSRPDDGSCTGRGAPRGPRNGKYKHGCKATSIWKAWWNAKQRCTNPNSPDWDNYGGRGITMAPEWVESFAAFMEHIGPKPDGALTLDRIDNDRGYEPGNVRWATRKDQAHNQRHRTR